MDSWAVTKNVSVPSTAPVSPAFVGGLLRTFDLAVIGMVAIAGYFIRVHPDRVDLDYRYVAAVLLAMMICSVFVKWFGAYGGDYVLSKQLRVDRVMMAWISTACVLLALAYTLKISELYSRGWAISWFAVTAGMLVVGRLALRAIIRQWAAQGRFAVRTIIVGAGEQGQRLAQHLTQLQDIRLHVLGFIDDRTTRIPSSATGYDVLGDIDHLIHLVRQNKVDQIIIALPWSAEQRLRELVGKLSMMPVNIRLAPDLAGFEFPDHEISQIGQLPMLCLMDRPISGWSHVSKTIEDRVLASLFLALAAPLFLLIAIAIKLDSRGSVFFKQRRYGFNNTPFEVWKFRSMYADSMPETTAGQLQQTARADARVTRIGRFLRKSSLDELPQLFNVLTGNMSIVGPRPHAMAHRMKGRLFDDIVNGYPARHRVKPGMTGWAQVNGWRGETDTLEKIEKRVEYDLYYIDNWSVRFDLMIILKTIFVVFKDDSAY
jgi:Undecaprenyl-phosphate glucose phosphotransferase